MCGICGKIALNPQAVSVDLISAMMKALTHRGPDDAGHYLETTPADNGAKVTVGLGHRRLSIIDLSVAGRQPLANEDESLWLVFNGEIYNHVLLRQQLLARGHRFRSRTDTEVILHLYEEKGIDALGYLNGMFAFALWDKPRQRLYLCRDRLGIKPLVYYRQQSSLCFASEIKALLQDGTVERKVDWQALNLYLTFNYVPAPLTIYQGMRKLLPGHYLMWENGRVSTHQYWEVPPAQTNCNPDLREHSRMLREVMEDAVRLQMTSDVPLGAFLSGGLDSSIIVALMARNSRRPVKTFTISYPDLPVYDESKDALSTATMYGTDHHEIRLNSRELLQVIPDVLSSLDEPFADSSLLPTFVVSRETRRGVTVALAGDGGDELFAGYRLYLGEVFYRHYRRLPLWVRRHALENWIQRLPESRNAKWLEYLRRVRKFIRGARGDLFHRYFLWRQIFSEELIDALLNRDSISNQPQLGRTWLMSHDRWPGDDLNRLLYAEVKDSLPCDMLTKVDLMSMKTALEVRVPFLDHRVVELAFQMPASMKLRGLQRKYILRKTFQDLLPPGMSRRPKRGFEVPISVWLGRELRPLLEHYLSPQRLKTQGIFNPQTVEELKKAQFHRREDTSWLLWNLIVFQFWYCSNASQPSL